MSTPAPPAARLRRLVGIASLTLALSLGTTPALAADEVSIPDPALRNCIAKRLGLGAEPTFDPLALAGIKTLICTSSEFSGIADLSGLEHLTALEDLSLPPGHVRDLSSLGGLTGLRWLYLPQNDVSDLAPLGNVAGLERLYLDDNPVTDLSPLLGMGSLELLALHGTALADTSVLARLSTLAIIMIGDTPATDYRALAGLPLRTLRVVDADLTSLDSIGIPASLTSANLETPRLASLDGLDVARGLDHLWVGISGLGEYEMSLADISALAGLHELTYVHLAHGQIDDLGALAHKHELVTLHLGDNRISDVGPLADLPALADLDLARNQIADLSALVGLDALNQLDVRVNRIASLEPLRGLPISALWASANQISDPSPLRDLPLLQVANLSSNRVPDLSSLEGISAGVIATEQRVVLSEAIVGVPSALGLRDRDGSLLCTTTTALPCADGLVTYPTSGTWVGRFSNAPAGESATFSGSFTQHAGPDRPFTRTYAPTMIGRPLVDMDVLLRSKPWTPTQATWTYSWYRDGKLISGTDPALYYYLPTVADRGHRLTGCITGHRDGYVDKTRCSAPSERVRTGDVFPSTRPKVTGTARTGQTLGTETGRWAAGATLHYQWQKNKKNITGATAATYTLRPGDVGDRIRVRVKGTKPGCHSTTEYSKAVTPAKGTITSAEPTLTGEPTVERTLVTDPGTWSPASVHLAYQWYRDGRAISKATGPQYLLRDADLGHTLTVRVTGSKSGYRTTSRTSAATAPVTVAR